MTVDAALAMRVGVPVAKKVWDSLSKKKDGTQRLAAVSTAFTKGMSAIEAFISVFGGEFLKALTDALGGGNGAFSYEGGIAGYIKLEGQDGSSPLKVLRDELNINLDRIALIEGDKAAVKNQFRGALHVWQGRYLELVQPRDSDDVTSTFAAMGHLLDDSKKSFKDAALLLGRTGLGTLGTLLLIISVCVATSTGVGIVAAISAFVIGVPWFAVGAFALPGAVLVVLAAVPLGEAQAMSACVQLAYKLIERQMAASAQAQTIQPSHQPTTEREQ